MSFLSGPATSPITLLDAFVTFLTAAGWVQDAYAADGTGKAYHGHKGTKFVHLRSFVNEQNAFLGTQSVAGKSGIAITGSTGYSGLANWYVQPGQPVQYGLAPDTTVTHVMSLPSGAVTNSWMFADAAGDNCSLVAINAFGVYTYVYFGDVVKVQAWTGGMYFGGSRQRNGAFGFGIDAAESGPPGSTGLLRADVDSHVGLWQNIENSIDTGKRLQSSTHDVNAAVDFGGQHISYGEFRKRARSTLTGGLLLLPTLWLVERDFGGLRTGGGFSLVGSIPDVFQTTSTAVAPGSTFSIGPDDYVVFPQFAIRKHP